MWPAGGRGLPGVVFCVWSASPLAGPTGGLSNDGAGAGMRPAGGRALPGVVFCVWSASPWAGPTRGLSNDGVGAGMWPAGGRGLPGVSFVCGRPAGGQALPGASFVCGRPARGQALPGVVFCVWSASPWAGPTGGLSNDGAGAGMWPAGGRALSGEMQRPPQRCAAGAVVYVLCGVGWIRVWGRRLRVLCLRRCSRIS